MNKMKYPRLAALLVCSVILAACTTGAPQPPAQPQVAVATAVAATDVPPTAAPTKTALPQASATPKKVVVPPTPQAVATVGETMNKATATAAPVKPAPTPLPKATQAAAKPTENGIAVKPASTKFGSITSVQSAMYLTLDGKGGDGKAIKGSMTVGLLDDVTAKKSNIEISGNLIGPLLSAQLRGFSPRGIGIFSVNGDTFARLDTLLTVCAKPKGGIPGLSDIATSLSTDGFLDMIGSDRNFPGKLVGDESLNGLTVQHYTLDLAAMKAAAQKRGQTSFPELSRGEMWLAKEGGYIVRLSVAGKGQLANIAGNSFDGSFDVILDTVSINQPVTITLPPSCSRPIEV